jgi:NADPH-dependent ferric siderophore reductase
VQPSETAEKPKKRPRVPRRVTVRRIQELSPRMRRITFGGDELAGFEWSGPAAHLKLLFPEAGTGSVGAYDPDAPRGTQTTRTYTPRRFDPSALTLDVDMVLHGEGPGATWAAQAQVGQELILFGPGRGYQVDPEAAWFVFAGDEVAVPAIETLLEAVPANARVNVFIEVDADNEKRTLAGPSGTDVSWLPRGTNGNGAPGSRLVAALSTFGWPKGNGRVYVGCEAGAVRQLRGTVIEASGLEKDRVITRGYWRVGAVNHPDSDYVTD